MCRGLDQDQIKAIVQLQVRKHLWLMQRRGMDTQQSLCWLGFVGIKPTSHRSLTEIQSGGLLEQAWWMSIMIHLYSVFTVIALSRTGSQAGRAPGGKGPEIAAGRLGSRVSGRPRVRPRLWGTPREARLAATSGVSACKGEIPTPHARGTAAKFRLC